MKEELLIKIQNHEAKIGIIGMGYVGLPLALTFLERGFTVIGFDVDPNKVSALSKGESYIKHLNAERVAKAAKTGRFTATTDFSKLSEPDAILICVPTPLTPQREPDMTYVVGSAEKIKPALRR